mmetsp:Transcript_29341/g.33639  ORF Transcript_29341/g.33639 Transcript_29341/m.33639 type:complete len:81 (+) Transcript_29341:468-710(+)
MESFDKGLFSSSSCGFIHRVCLLRTILLQKKSPAKRQSSTVHYEIHDGFFVRKNMTWRTTHSLLGLDMVPSFPHHVRPMN